MTATTQAAALALAALLTASTGCASGQRATDGASPEPGQTVATNQQWPVKTRYVADLWLHGYAMLLQDTTTVPFFAPGYRDRMTQLKNRSNVITSLDANREQLAQRFTSNPNLVGSQFLALYFGTWEQLKEAVELFLRAEGDPRRASNQQTFSLIQFLAANFPTAADRDWVRLYMMALEDESAKFYQSHWNQAQRERAPTLARVDSLWQRTYRPKLQGFLNNTQQESGDFYLSLPLDGEGRTVKQDSRNNVIAVGFPDQPADAVAAIYVFAHEAVGAVTGNAIADNITPAEARSGIGDRLQSAALVRGGAMLLAKVAPELVDGYARYYLRAASASVPSQDPLAELAALFPLPDAVREAIERQIDVTLGGI